MAYVINLDDYKLVGTHWVVIYVRHGKATYFDSFGVFIFLKRLKIL